MVRKDKIRKRGLFHFWEETDRRSSMQHTIRTEKVRKLTYAVGGKMGTVLLVGAKNMVSPP